MNRKTFLGIVLKDGAALSCGTDGRLGEVVDFVDGERHSLVRKIDSSISDTAGNPKSITGMLKKSASGVPCLRRSGFAQAGRLFAVLTY